MLSPIEVSPDNIWQYKQNQPSLIISDMATLGIPERVTAKILMARGVYKWLAARRDFIKLKNSIRDELTSLYRAIEKGEIQRNSPAHFEAKGRIKALQEVRAEIRKICHSERWRFPDNDIKSKRKII